MFCLELLEQLRSYRIPLIIISLEILVLTSQRIQKWSGVPQGTVLGSFLLPYDMLCLGTIIHGYDVSFHCYVDERVIIV